MVDSVSPPSSEHRSEPPHSSSFRSSPSTLGDNFCRACGFSMEAWAEFCSKCGVPQHGTRNQRHPNARLGLILNVFFPGVGTLVLGKTKIGIAQLVLGWVAMLLSLFLVALPFFFVVWIWAIVTAVKSFREPPKLSSSG